MPNALRHYPMLSNTMPLNTKSRADLKEWKALEAHKNQIAHLEIRDLFKKDLQRFEKFHIQHEGLLFDYSKQRITNETVEKLVNLARACDIEDWRNEMFEGAIINHTEDRAVLHTAVRNKYQERLIVDGEDIIPGIHEVFDGIKKFTNTIRTEKKFKHIINIGIGGSDLGAFMVCDALKPYCDPHFQMHFISNIDPAHLYETLHVIDPHKTLVIVASKTFTTHETIVNATSVKQWMQEALKTKDISGHFVAVTQNTDEAKKFGVKSECIFRIWDWVGGRYSLWSAIGLSACIALGFENFAALLDGAYSMDEHFRTAPLEQNMPVILAMIGIWNRNFLKYPALAIIPYAQNLHRFIAYMQQLDMESNGKCIDRRGQKVPYDTGPMILGETGTNGQHAFFQQIHQGTTIIPIDFIAPIKPFKHLGRHQEILLANMIAQGKALIEGRDNPNPSKSFDGNRPSNTILMETLNPYHLGMLLALYEHKIFVQGIIWNINSFDQHGVELGKRLTVQILESFSPNRNYEEEIAKHDSSTLGLINCILK